MQFILFSPRLALSLPQVVTFSDGSTIRYMYSADGTKLRTTHVINGTTTTTDYCGNVIYENGTAKRLLNDEGYVDLSNNTYYYYLKDHQGNNRVVINSSGTVQETNHYYPFGGLFSISTNVQPYKYNGKELDTKGGLNLYDYGARHYDAALGRWHVVDPMAEKMGAWSPYGYCFNNPMKFVDEEGEIPFAANILGAALGATVEYVGQVAANVLKDNFTLSDLTNVDFGDILISAGEGFITSGASAVKNGIAKASIKIGAEVLRNAVDVENNSGNLNVSTNSVQETIVNSSVGLIGGEIKTGIKTSPINTKSVNKATEAARKASHSKGISFTGDQARQVQKETKQYNASVKEINNVISDNANSTLGNISASISKLEEDEK